MPRPNKMEQEFGYLRSAWDELRTLQADYQGVISIYASTTGRPGVFTFRLVFAPLFETAENYLGANAIQFEYPSAHSSQTLASALWAQSQQLTRVVADAYSAIKGRVKGA